jgi:hypothetical protein
MVTCCVVDPDPYEFAFVWLSLIRIRIGNADPDPGAWKLTKIYKQTWFIPFQQGFCTFVLYRYVFDLLPTLRISHVKIQLFVT